MSHEFPLVDVEGRAYEMGRQHGEQVRALIQKYVTCIERFTGTTRDVLCRNALSFLSPIERLSSRIVEEIRGLADGAQLSFAEALLCQVRCYAIHSCEPGCTAFALKGTATRGGNVLIGQNQEFEPEFADVAILLRVRPTDGRPRALMFTFAGQIGYSGINELGVAHFSNALYGSAWRPGVPPYPVKRVLLEQETVSDALCILRQHQPCYASNLVLADSRGEIADVEVRPEGIQVYEDESPDCRLHTNHYLCSEFQRFEDNFLPDSVSRLKRLRFLIQRAWGEMTPDLLKGFLADHEGDPAGICRHGDHNMQTISGYIAEPTKRLLHVRRGHGCLGNWNTYEV